jgi:integrase
MSFSEVVSALDTAVVTSPVTAGVVAVDPDDGVDRVLTAEAARRVAEGLAANTRRAYAHDWAVFTDWCAQTGRRALPASAETLANYVTALAEQELAPSTVDRALACVLARHDAADLPKPATKAARLALRSYRRERAADGHRARRAPAIDVAVLRQLVDATPADTLAGLRDRAALILGFALMGRRSELAALDIADISETDDGLEVFIATTNTDRDAHGETVPIPYGSHPDTCPVRVVRTWLAALAERGFTVGALLRPVDRHGRLGGEPGHLGRGNRTRITGEAINLIVRRAALRAALPNANTYTAHSLRAGGATAAARAGAGMTAIAAHGRWAEGSPVVHTYIRAADRWRDNPMRGIGL